MAREDHPLDRVRQSVESVKLVQQSNNHDNDGAAVQITCFSDLVDDVTLHFQIIRLPNQIYVWIGCNSAKFGRLYAAASTRPSNTVSVSSSLGGASDNTDPALLED